ncbi:hypothetical protein FZW96_11060 [Bacillus sp. BGMRC 2118]|nr:hypothetical protein FZW96_11060 [Bacillus sp. BGMRC 2118]
MNEQVSGVLISSILILMCLWLIWDKAILMTKEKYNDKNSFYYLFGWVFHLLPENVGYWLMKITLIVIYLFVLIMTVYFFYL